MTDAERIDELEATLADEEAGHQETLRLWLSAKSRIAELEAALAQHYRATASRINDIARRIGPARTPASIKEDLEELANQYEFWGAKP